VISIVPGCAAMASGSESADGIPRAVLRYDDLDLAAILFSIETNPALRSAFERVAGSFVSVGNQDTR
jgi:hypothetical protein